MSRPAGDLARALGVLLLLPGLAMLAFGLISFAVPRARWSESTPPAGAQLPDPPRDMALRFDRALHSSSYALVWRMEPRPGRIAARDSLAAGDPAHRTWAVAFAESLTTGRYEVSWHARTPALYWLPLGTQGRIPFVVGDTAMPMRAARQWAEGSLASAPGRDARAVVVLSGLILVGLSRLVSLRSARAG